MVCLSPFFFFWHFTTRHQQLLPQLLAVPLRSGNFACTKFRLHKDFLGWNAQPVHWINTPAMLMATWSCTVISLQESKLWLSFFMKSLLKQSAERSHCHIYAKGHTLYNKISFRPTQLVSLYHKVTALWSVQWSIVSWSF